MATNLLLLVLFSFMATAVRCDVNADISYYGNYERIETDQNQTNAVFDREFARIRQSVMDNELDPLPLSSDSDTFEIELFNRTINGSIWVGDGSVTGLSTIHRAGNITGEFGPLIQDSVAGVVALTGMKVQYSGRTEIGRFGSDFTFEFSIPSLTLNFKTNIFLIQSEILLDYCYIQDFSYSHLNLDGFGPLDTFLYDLLANTLLQVLNEDVQEKVEGVVCDLLERAFQDTGEATTTAV